MNGSVAIPCLSTLYNTSAIDTSQFAQSGNEITVIAAVKMISCQLQPYYATIVVMKIDVRNNLGNEQHKAIQLLAEFGVKLKCAILRSDNEQ